MEAPAPLRQSEPGNVSRAAPRMRQDAKLPAPATRVQRTRAAPASRPARQGVQSPRQHTRFIDLLLTFVDTRSDESAGAEKLHTRACPRRRGRGLEIRIPGLLDGVRALHNRLQLLHFPAEIPRRTSGQGLARAPSPSRTWNPPRPLRQTEPVSVSRAAPRMRQDAKLPAPATRVLRTRAAPPFRPARQGVQSPSQHTRIIDLSPTLPETLWGAPDPDAESRLPRSRRAAARTAESLRRPRGFDSARGLCYVPAHFGEEDEAATGRDDS
jgi:hypothetical protein